MATIKIVHKGATYEVENREQLKDLLETLGLLPQGSQVRQSGSGRSDGPGLGLYLVTTEVAQNPQGIDSDRVATLADVKGTRGLAGLSRTWTRILGELGFALEEVLIRERRGERYFWKPGKRVKAAVTALEKARVEGLL